MQSDAPIAGFFLDDFFEILQSLKFPFLLKIFAVILYLQNSGSLKKKYFFVKIIVFRILYHNFPISQPNSNHQASDNMFFY